jgi:hypothetical protein
MTDLTAEIIQAINRIRVRKTIDNEGRCNSANIYITLPVSNYDTYKKFIKDEMPKVNFYDWVVAGAITVFEQQEGYLPAIVEWLESNVYDGEEISIYEPRNALNIRSDSYSKIIARKNFNERLNDFGFEVILKTELNSRGKPKVNKSKFISKIIGVQT